ncbi:MAG: DUF1552 domain-containing protein [Planctomycetota bacterium]
MTQSQLSRRNVLRAAGITLALPWLESDANAGTETDAMQGSAPGGKPPKRFCAMYFPYGVAVPGKEHQDAEWNWFPDGEGSDFRFRKSLEVLEPVRADLTVLGGLSHPLVRKIGGHDSGDTFLTGADFRVATGLKNSISLDQFAAKTQGLGSATRFSSLVLSTDGGVGMPTRANTLSFDAKGQPLPSLNRPAAVFERLFSMKEDSIEAQRRGLTRTGSHLDLLLEQASDLNRKLGMQDQRKLDQYLSSVREVEKDVERAQQWLDVPRPSVNAQGLSLEADDNTPGELIKTMLDLIVLAFQTDSTRFATYQFGSMHGAISIAGKFPQLLGMKKNMHGLAHGGKKPGGAAQQGEWDRFLASQLGYLIQRMKDIPEGDGTLLDHTALLYGSSNSTTHTNLNYPLIVAGGKSMGYQHGQHLQYGKEVPLANLYLMILNRLGVQVDQFADSLGTLDI